MIRAVIAALSLIVFSGATAVAEEPAKFKDLDSYIKNGKQIVTVGVPRLLRLSEDGYYRGEVFVDNVLLGPVNISTATRMMPIRSRTRLTRDKRYLLYSTVAPPDFEASAQLSVIPMAYKNETDLFELKGKSLKEQLTIIFRAKLAELGEESKLLEKALGINKPRKHPNKD